MTPEMHVNIIRRLASLLYDSLLVLAVIFIAGAAFSLLATGGSVSQPHQSAQLTVLQGPLRYVFQLYLLVVGAGYYVLFWVKRGQTLGMKTWRIRLERNDGSKLDLKTAILRALYALPSYGLGIGVVWALFDRQGQYLHDRLAGTRLVNQPPKK